MQTEIGKWGNSAAMRIPAELMRQSGLSVGQKAEVVFENGCLTIKPLKPKISRAERYAKIIASVEAIGPDEEIDWGPDVGNEIVE
jgi:antitoxin MazE